MALPQLDPDGRSVLDYLSECARKLADRHFAAEVINGKAWLSYSPIAIARGAHITLGQALDALEYLQRIGVIEFAYLSAGDNDNNPHVRIRLARKAT